MSDRQMPMFPRVIAEIITDYCAIWCLTEAAAEHEDLFSMNSLSSNIRACDYIKESIRVNQWSDLAKSGIDWKAITVNPGMCDMFDANGGYPEYICVDHLADVSFPWTIRALRDELARCNGEIRPGLLYPIAMNPNFIDVIEANLDRMDNDALSMNPGAIHILEKYPERINWRFLSSEPLAIRLIEQNLDKVDWETLSNNVAATHILETHLDKVSWLDASYNGNIPLLTKYPDKIDWRELSACNKRAELVVPFARKHLDKLMWGTISGNQIYIELCRENPDRVDWYMMNENMLGGELLLVQEELDPEVIEWQCMVHDPAIFELFRCNALLDLLINGQTTKKEAAYRVY